MGGRSCTAFLLANALAGLCAPVAALAVTLNVNSTADTLSPATATAHCAKPSSTQTATPTPPRATARQEAAPISINVPAGV